MGLSFGWMWQSHPVRSVALLSGSVQQGDANFALNLLCCAFLDEFSQIGSTRGRPFTCGSSSELARQARASLAAPRNDRYKPRRANCALARFTCMDEI